MFSVNMTQAHIFRGIRSNKMVSFDAKKTDQRIKKDKIIQSDLFGYSYKEQELLDSSRKMILNAMLSFYSFDCLSDNISPINYVKSYCHQIRCFFNTGIRYGKDAQQPYPYDGKLLSLLSVNEINQHVLVDSYKKFYKDNKNSDSAVEKLTKDVITLLSFEEFFIYLDSLAFYLEDEKLMLFIYSLIRDHNWYEKYLDEFFETYPAHTEIIKKFIIAAIYDSDLKFTVSKKEPASTCLDLTKNQLKITWYIDQEFIFSNSDYEREEAVKVLFDDGLLMADLGKFDKNSVPKVIGPSLIWDGKLDFDGAVEQEIQKVCDAWRKGRLGKVTIKRGKKYISLHWEFPESFRPYNLQGIRENCRSRFNDVIEYEYLDDFSNGDEIFQMIISAHGY
jgi:hypothetical protein